MPTSPAPAVHAFVPGDGTGSCLHPPTRDCGRPALPFGGNFRVVDLVPGTLLNCAVVQGDLRVRSVGPRARPGQPVVIGHTGTVAA